MIEGVTITPLKQIIDERGKVMHMLRTDYSVFDEFGEIYFSTVNRGAVKGWHIHKKMTLNYAVPFGLIKLVLFDERKDSPTRGNLVEIFSGPENYQLITVPPMVWNGFKGLNDFSLVANCATHAHDPDEIERCDPFENSIPYTWDIRHG